MSQENQKQIRLSRIVLQRTHQPLSRSYNKLKAGLSGVNLIRFSRLTKAHHCLDNAVDEVSCLVDQKLRDEQDGFVAGESSGAPQAGYLNGFVNGWVIKWSNSSWEFFYLGPTLSSFCLFD